jgi:GT2 family glycosyltransferase
VSVIVVNWNGRHWLEQCLPAVLDQSCSSFDVTVVDNGSLDGSQEWLRQAWPQVHLLELGSNHGFAAANNRGIEAASGKWIATLNNDALPDRAWLEALLEGASGERIGMVASRIVLWGSPDVLDSAGIEVDRAGIAWNRCWNRPVDDAAAELMVFGPSAAAALYRRDMLTSIGLFDERYFAYYEDVDLAWRAQRAGWRCRYAPQATVRHWHSATGAAMKGYYLGRNKWWTILKNYPAAALMVMLPVILSYDLLMLLGQMVTTRSRAGLFGRWHALKNWRVAWAERWPGQAAVLSPLTPPWRLRSRLAGAHARWSPP